MGNLNTWRDEHANDLMRGEALEALARSVRLPDFMRESDWTIRFDDAYRHAMMTLRGATIQTFAAAVKIFSESLGPPSHVGTKEDEVWSERAPDFVARWERPSVDGNVWNKLRIEIRSVEPACRIDPRTHFRDSLYVEAVRPALHPECADVLTELQELVDAPERKETDE